MMRRTPHYEEYLQILKEELIPAMGCTEPIAIALAAAKARETLGMLPQRCRVLVSGNMVKNAKAVTVPNTGGLQGIPASVAIGVVAGRGDLDLEVLSQVTEEQIAETKAYLETHSIVMEQAKDCPLLYIRVEVEAEGHTAVCEIAEMHTNVVLLQRDDEILFQAEKKKTEGGSAPSNRDLLTVKEIIDFADCVEIADIAPTIQQQIDFNTAIAQRGIQEKWGAGVGRTILKTCNHDDVAELARAAAAAAADARMGGCTMPVVIVAGSGDQGLAVSLPVIVYAHQMKSSEEELYRALVVASLVAIHEKESVGRLSAFCGSVSAGCAAAAGIAYLHGDRYDVIAHTITNGLGICSGMVCDGAKPACAGKIAAAVEAGILGWRMYRNEQCQFLPGEGILGADVEKTIANVGRMASQGMRQTDQEILNIMLEQ